MRWPILLVILAACVFLLWVLHKDSLRSSAPAQSGVISGANSYSQNTTSEDWSADNAKLDRMESNFNEFRFKILNYSTQPEFLSQQAEFSSLMSIADQEHQLTRIQCGGAIQKRNRDRFLTYSMIEGNADEILEEVLDAIEYPNPDFYNKFYNAQTQAQSQIDNAQHSVAPKLLGEYRQDPASMQRYGQSPTELSALEQDATARIGQARSLLANGKILSAQITAAIANLDNMYVATSLWEYHEDVYMPRFLEKFKELGKR